ncbi:MAG TPA: phosphotransferase [Candidatus Saccharimonadales bacterium]|nr:phosphotransferase [Candidatus Saccharimonadales bacterium]
MSDKYFERLGYDGDSEPLIADVSAGYDLGTVQESSVLTVGFEDCNVRVQTDTGQFVIKAFGKFRSNEDIERYVGVMQAVTEGGVHHPALHESKDGSVLFQHSSGVSAVAMDFIEGHTYFDTKTVPTDEELQLIAAEAVKIHDLDINPPYVFDSWAIPHIHKMYEAALPFLDEAGKQLADAALERYDAIDLEQLEKRFTHGDIISTNTLLGNDGKVWILDFAVSNIYPKIQELAVIASSLLAGSEFVSLGQRVERVKKAYLGAGGKLTDYEQQALMDYAIAAAAMEFMGGHKAKFVDKEDAEECDYWIGVGKQALTEALR